MDNSALINVDSSRYKNFLMISHLARRPESGKVNRRYLVSFVIRYKKISKDIDHYYDLL